MFRSVEESHLAKGDLWLAGKMEGEVDCWILEGWVGGG